MPYPLEPLQEIVGLEVAGGVPLPDPNGIHVPMMSGYIDAYSM